MKNNSQDISHTHEEVDFSNQLFYSLGFFLTYWLQGIHQLKSHEDKKTNNNIKENKQNENNNNKIIKNAYLHCHGI